MDTRSDDPSGPERVDEEIIPIVEEQVRVEKRVREGRTVTVRTRPVTEMVTVSEPIIREHVTVERVPVDRVVAELPSVRQEGDLTIIPVVEERVRMVVELVLREEIHLRRTREQDVVTAQVERRRTEAIIDE